MNRLLKPLVGTAFALVSLVFWSQPTEVQAQAEVMWLMWAIITIDTHRQAQSLQSQAPRFEHV